jgi:hypothetical protein
LSACSSPRTATFGAGEELLLSHFSVSYYSR